jgi:hypothetical protein
MCPRRPACSPCHLSGCRPQAGGPDLPNLARGGPGRHTFLSPSRWDNHMYDLDEAISRLHQLDDEALEGLVCQLDEALTGCRTGPVDTDTQNTITVAGAARILLRQRRTRAKCARANTIVHDLISASESTE